MKGNQKLGPHKYCYKEKFITINPLVGFKAVTMINLFL